jgi:hypothetical protein
MSAGAGAASVIPPSADAEPAVSPIVALITGEKNERGIPSAVFIVRLLAPFG